MKKEIERKFIVIDKSYKKLGKYKYCIQGYIPSTNEPLIRIRTIGNKSFITIKSNINGITRLEYEYEIPNDDAKDLLNIFCKDSIVEKNRYIIHYKSTLWEVDEFLGHNNRLVVAEVELQSEDADFDRPEWIGDEVSTNEKYYNYNLSSNPYNKWKTD